MFTLRELKENLDIMSTSQSWHGGERNKKINK